MLKACATCAYWLGEEGEPGVRQCHWPIPVLPFWAAVGDGPDHADWTRAEDGRTCPTWESN